MLGILVVLGLIFWANSWKRETYVVVSGKEGASYHSFAEGVASLKHQAINDLVSERLNADESFRILQDLLEQCITEVQRKKSS